MSEFNTLGLAAPVLEALTKVGYETPSPIQAATIPVLLEGQDLIGQAQTGTGKTAAFALPMLSTIDLKANVRTEGISALILTPTRELAIQVAEACQKYAHFLPNFHVLPIYGGQGYDHQLRQLRRGVHVVVGTPGRVMDHIRRGTLNLSRLQMLVLDEADEMLRMGFIDDVEWILSRTPEERQIALFSATMPPPIRKVAQRYLNNPQEIKIKAKTETATTISQRYWQVSGLHKLDALTRILEVEEFDAVIIFVRTKTMTTELSERLNARGYDCEALNGDIPQNLRERTIEKLKAKKIDFVVATDVAARGLDVPRISHVVNYDIPQDIESYVHRIGRTGRAGNTGEAILFVSNRERHLLRAIEKHTRQKITSMQLPSTDAVNEQRRSRFKARITETLDGKDLDLFEQVVSEYQEEFETDPARIAAALAYLVQGETPLFIKDQPRRARREHDDFKGKSERQGKNFEREPRRKKQRPDSKARPLKDDSGVEMKRFQVQVGYDHEVTPRHIVGAIANEANLDSRYIGQIEIHDDFTTVDLPANLSPEAMKDLQKAWVCGRRLAIHVYGEAAPAAKADGRPPKKKYGNSKKAKNFKKNKSKQAAGDQPLKRQRKRKPKLD